MKKLFAFIMALMCCGNLVIDASAINLNIIDKENIKCDFEYKNSYVYTTKKEDLKFIKKGYPI